MKRTLMMKLTLFLCFFCFMIQLGSSIPMNSTCSVPNMTNSCVHGTEQQVEDPFKGVRTIILFTVLAKHFGFI